MFLRTIACLIVVLVAFSGCSKETDSSTAPNNPEPETPAFLMSWGTEGTADGEFDRPISHQTRRFVDAWARLAVENHVTIVDSAAARKLIEERERQLKHGLARLQNLRALENWGGESSLGRLSYRWLNARQLIADVQAGLRVEEAAVA